MNMAEEISYFSLITASAGSLSFSDTEDAFFISMAGITLIYAVLGALRRANISNINQMDLIEKGHEQLKILLPFIVLPSFVTAVWLRYGIGKRAIHKSFGVIHSVIGILTSLAYSTQPSMDQKYMDGMVGVETVSLVGAGLYMENYYAAAAGVVFVAAYYLTQYYNGSDLPIPKEDLYNYLLAGFVLLAMESTMVYKCPFM